MSAEPSEHESRRHPPGLIVQQQHERVGAVMPHAQTLEPAFLMSAAQEESGDTFFQEERKYPPYPLQRKPILSTQLTGKRLHECLAMPGEFPPGASPAETGGH